jgi:hypothetical protein
LIEKDLINPNKKRGIQLKVENGQFELKMPAPKTNERNTFASHNEKRLSDV